MVNERAPAKVNLYLHVTGKRADDYHLLDSLIGFADIADRLEATLADEVTLRLEGPYAHLLSPIDNSALRAAQMLRKRAGVTTGAALTLHKYLPVAAGIGGGSADAAATLRLLMRLWGVTLSDGELMAMALELGADVPACFRSRSLYMAGIGENIEKGPQLSGMPVLLVNPGSPLKTAEVFAGFKSPFSSPVAHRQSFATPAACAEFLAGCHNDLETPAIELMPVIQSVLGVLSRQKGCMLARMSGSGATCFGLFADAGAAQMAALSLASQHADWWVKATVLL